MDGDMTPDEYLKMQERSYQFFLSELKNISDEDLALILELMRASHHIQNIHKLMSKIYPKQNQGDEEDEEEFVDDSLITMVFNISAAQSREALKLFWIFSESAYFQHIRGMFSKDENAVIEKLIFENSEFKEKRGFLYEVLEPVRNLVFHYESGKSNEAALWIREQRELEVNKKPPYWSIDLDKYGFFPGGEFDGRVFSKYLFWGSDGFNTGMKSLENIWRLEKSFMEATKIIVQKLVDDSNITKREVGWFLKYHYGFHS